MKSNHRLEVERLAEALGERGLVDASTLRHVLGQSTSTGELFTEILVRERLISDWELARVCSDIFNLPFLPIASYVVSEEVSAELNHDFLRRNCLVPMDRFGKIMTVSLPGMVPADVLINLGQRTGCTVMAVAGSVSDNRAWLEQHLPVATATIEQVAAALPGDAPGGDWANIFDAGEQAVQKGLKGAPDSDMSLDLDLDLGLDEDFEFVSEPNPDANSSSDDDLDEYPPLPS